MDNEDFLKLTEAIYNLTEFISDEALKNKIRERALEIFSNLNLFFSENPKATSLEKKKLSIQIEKDIEILENCLKLACSREDFYPLNFLIIENEYDKIKREVKEGLIKEERKSEKKPTLKKEEPFSSVSKNQSVFDLTDRQKKILKILEKKEKAQVQDFKEFFSNVSKRTLRRDLDNLLKKGLIIRVGKWNGVFYQLKRDRTEDGTKEVEDRTEDRTGDRTEISL